MKATPYLFASFALLACSSEETGAATFTTWGEAYIEEGIPSGDGGFVDEWSLEYDKFLVGFARIEVASSDGEVGGRAEGPFVVDNVQPGRKQLRRFPELEARAWDRVSYQIRPPAENATRISATREDLQILQTGGYSLYIEATARKGDTVKTLALGFATATQYTGCQAQQNGKETAGIVVTNGAEDTSELTTHGDHFFYDRLQGSAGANVETSLRFETIAAADKDEDGQVTAEELAAQPIDVKLYDPSGLPADDMLEFMTGLSRTVGHFRGEGECSVSRIEE